MSSPSSRDLSEFHQSIGDWLEPTESLALSVEQRENFDREGYIKGIRVLSEDHLAVLRQELNEFFVPDHAGRDLWYEYHADESQGSDTVLFHALGAWRLRPGFHDLLWNPVITHVASQLLGGAVRFWHDQLFCKPARHGGVVAWHQDYSYWTRTKPMAHLTCWIGLDDSSMDNGCLHYVPGSHKWDLLPVTGLAGEMDAIQEVLSPEQWQQFQSPVAIEMKAGECSFHHSLLVHGSFENRTEHPRRAAVLNLVLDGVRSASNEPLLEGVPPIAVGQKLEGQFFPLLYDPAIQRAR